jgi:GAF domain-containing protein
MARRLLGADAAMVSLVGNDRQTFKGHDGLRADIAAEGGTLLSHSFCQYAVATGERLVVGDARTSALLNQSPAISEHDVVAYAGVPLQLRAGQEAVGTLCVVGSSPRDWSEGDVETLEELAEIVQAEMQYRISSRTAELVERLAFRLPEPVSRLGDAVRTLTGLADTPTDPRLPRSADLARGRLEAVETLTDDL